MQQLVLLLLVLVTGAASLASILWLLRERFPKLFFSDSKNLRRMSDSQAALAERLIQGVSDEPSEGLLRAINESELHVVKDSRQTIVKQLKYAGWRISPMVFHLFEILLSIFVFTSLIGLVNPVVLIISLFAGPAVMRTALSLAIDRRHRRFDADYPQMLMSMVGLLKTGMMVVQALDVASKGLEAKSLVRNEIQMMIERLRLGIPEEKSIGAFAEDIYHPEIELFVQALLLNRRVGGNLSDTLERLAKQVRKRQFFKGSAQAAIGLQRGSLWIILAIIVSLQGFLIFVHPDLVLKAFETPIGWHVWQAAIVLVIIAVFWIRNVTNIRM